MLDCAAYLTGNVAVLYLAVGGLEAWVVTPFWGGPYSLDVLTEPHLDSGMALCK